MATYAVGDIQGCFRTLRKLVARCGFDPKKDKLWLAGDLVNRGPRSDDVLRYLRDLGDRAVAVPGNHDLHLIARALDVASAKSRDTLDDVLKAKDRDELIGWLRARPLVHYEPPHLLVHAGLLPAWSERVALQLAQELEGELRGNGAAQLLRREKDAGQHLTYDDGDDTPRRRRTALSVLTRVRVCSAPRTMRLDFTGPPEDAPGGSAAWFAMPHQRKKETTVLFGHWSTLGLRVVPGAVGLDSGCVWGKTLSAMRLEDGKIFQEPYAD